MKMDTYVQNLRYDWKASGSLKLKFSSEVNSPVYTGQMIIGKAGGDGGNTSLQVMLVDNKTQKMITTGPLASAKMKIVLLPGDYCGSTTREFEDKTVVHWRKKKNILQGGPYFDLKHGCGTIVGLKLKHDRYPISNVKFRLGAMVVDCPNEVEEAITDPFEVKDLRNLPKTIRKLSLDDNVGRLKNISNKGAGKIRMRLKRENICTVREFLDMYSSNPRELQKICDMKGKKWEMTVNHAKTSLKGNVRIDSTSHQSNTMVCDGCFEFDDNCYRPQRCENEHFMSISMIIDPSLTIDPSLSTNDFEVWDPSCDVFEPGQASQEAALNGAWALGGNIVEGNGVKAKKRWMKLRIIVTFTHKVG
ncbi:putative CALMODULIN-BINDING PROTEIN60 [Helianthus debilis subsp. tardiflorus]